MNDEKWDYREPDETRKFPGRSGNGWAENLESFLAWTEFAQSQVDPTKEHHKFLDDNFWELLSKPLPESLTQDDGPFYMGEVK